VKTIDSLLFYAASYAGIAKLNSSATVSVVNPTAVTVNTMLPVQPSTNVRSNKNNKVPSNQANTSPGNNTTDNYRQNNRNEQWSENTQQEYRPNTNQPTVSIAQQVFVGSLPADFTREDLIDCFSAFGSVLDVKINYHMNEHKKVDESYLFHRNDSFVID
jgi:hypothetical protein